MRTNKCMYESKCEEICWDCLENQVLLYPASIKKVLNGED